jgi:hypothetical protein
MTFDYEKHPYVRARRKVLPGRPFAIIDRLASNNWQDSNPFATPDETHAALLAPENVLWSSHPIDETRGEIVLIHDIGSPGWPPITVVEVSA